MLLKLLLVRHAVTAWHGQGRVLGHNDIPLNEEGNVQARRLAESLSDLPITRVIASPLSRAAQTAEALAAPHGVNPTIDPRLTDLRVGEWDGMTFADLALRDDFRRFQSDPLGVPIPGGESLEQGLHRALAVIHDLGEGRDQGEMIALVTHADIVRFLLCHYLQASLASYLRFRISVASVSTISLARGKAEILGVNWTPSYA
jgi:broad specificity phosphatase PhoE